MTRMKKVEKKSLSFLTCVLRGGGGRRRSGRRKKRGSKNKRRRKKIEVEDVTLTEGGMRGKGRGKGREES